MDVKWTTDNEQVSSGHGLSLTLDYIRLNHFVICLIGSRYGQCREDKSLPLYCQDADINEKYDWLDRNFLIAQEGGYVWLSKNGNEHKSIQEIELMQATTYGNPEDCYFYFRQPEHLDERLEGLNATESQKLSAIYLPKDSAEDGKVRLLKQTIVNNGWRVKYYTTLNELGQHLMNDWTDFVDHRLPQIPPEIMITNTDHYAAWVANESFAYRYRRNFYTSPEIAATLSAITDFCTRPYTKSTQCKSFDYRNYSIRKEMLPPPEPATSKSILLLDGEKGSGKSAILAKWAEEFAKDCPDVKLIYVFVSSSHYNRNVCNFLWTCVKEIRQHHCLKEGRKPPRFFAEYRPKTFEELREMFLGGLSYDRCVVMIDGLNEMCGDTALQTKHLRDLSWLPFPLPGECRFIVSSTNTDITHQKLCDRSDVLTMNCPLFDGNMVKEHLTQSVNICSQYLTKKVMEKIQEFKIGRKPLFLTLLSNEITRHNVHHNLMKYVSSRRDLGSLYQYWMGIVKRWTIDYSWSNPSHKSPEVALPDMRGWVADVIILIAISRNGLKRSDILALLQMMGYIKRSEVLNFDWLRLRSCLGRMIHEKANGCLMFSSQFLRENTLYFLLKNVTNSMNDSLLPSPGYTPNAATQAYHHVIGTYFMSCQNLNRKASELPYHQAMSGNITALKNTIMDPKLLLKLAGDEDWPSFISGLDCYCDMLVSAGVDLCLEFTALLHKYNIIKTLTPSKMNTGTSASLLPPVHIDSKLSSLTANLPSSNLDYSSHEVNMKWLSWHVGHLLLRRGEHDVANWIFVELYTYMVATYPPPQDEWILFCRLQKKLAEICVDVGDTNAARGWYKKALETLTDIINTKDESVEHIVNDLHGSLLCDNGDLYLLDQDLDTAEQCYNEARGRWSDCGNLPPMADACVKIGALREKCCDFQKAETYYKEALDTRRYWYGNGHHLVSDNLYMLGCLKMRQDNNKGYDLKKSEDYLRQALAIEDAIDGEGHKSLHLANILAQLGYILRRESGSNERNEALQFFQRAMDIKNIVLGSDHSESHALMTSLHELKNELSQPEMVVQSDRSNVIRAQSAEFFRQLCRRRHRKTQQKYRKIPRPCSRITCRRPSSVLSNFSHLCARDKILLEDRLKVCDRSGSSNEIIDPEKFQLFGETSGEQTFVTDFYQSPRTDKTYSYNQDTKAGFGHSADHHSVESARADSQNHDLQQMSSKTTRSPLSNMSKLHVIRPHSSPDKSATRLDVKLPKSILSATGRQRRRNSSVSYTPSTLLRAGSPPKSATSVIAEIAWADDKTADGCKICNHSQCVIPYAHDDATSLSIHGPHSEIKTLLFKSRYTRPKSSPPKFTWYERNVTPEESRPNFRTHKHLANSTIHQMLGTHTGPKSAYMYLRY